MRLLKILKYLPLCLIVLVNITYSQYIEDYENTSKNDLIDALNFAGINIISFDLEKFDRNCTFNILVDEYAGKDNLIGSETLVNQSTEYKIPDEDGHLENKYIEKLRVVSKVLNNSFDKIYLMFSTERFTAHPVLNINEEYQRKHYWVRFAKSDFKIGEKIPLLFYGSEWDDIMNGKKVTRFCCRNEVPTDLNDSNIEFMPHFFVVSYLLEEIEKEAK